MTNLSDDQLSGIIGGQALGKMSLGTNGVNIGLGSGLSYSTNGKINTSLGNGLTISTDGKLGYQYPIPFGR